jgi:hypothetical protein
MSKREEKRNKAIVAMVEAGLTLEVVGAVWGLSRQRVFAIVEAETNKLTNNNDTRTV